MSLSLRLFFLLFLLPVLGMPLSAQPLPQQDGSLAVETLPAKPDVPVVRLGVLAYLGSDAAEQEWRSLQRYFEQTLPQYSYAFTYGDLSTLRRAVAAGELDFVLTNPGQYVELEASYGVSRIATLEKSEQPSSNIAVGAAVVALRHRDDLQTIDDLRGQTLGATAEDAFGGFQTLWRELHELNIDPSRDLESLLFTGFPMQRVLEAVDAGRADAGVVRACLVEDLPDWQTRYKVLSARYEPALSCTVSTRLYPNWPMAALRYTPPDLARTVAIALLQMDPAVYGISWTVSADYQIVHEAFRELQIGPYTYLRGPDLGNLLQSYWPFGMLMVLGLFFWGLYTVRSEYLVRTRTAELEQALQEREAIAQRMQANQEHADHLARLSVLGELSSTLAHELSQPLAGVNNYAHSLLRRLDNGRLTAEAVREASENIVTMSHAAAGVLKRIKGFARKRSGARDWHDLSSLVDESIALFKGMQRQSPEIYVTDHIPVGQKVRVDALQIQQILLNLLKNGQDAMREIPPEEQRMFLTMETRDGWTWLHVRDYGVGMSAGECEDLFTPFYTTKADGLGLGLSICNSIAEAHGGQLHCCCADPGPGMIFSLSLPIHDHDTRPGNLSAGR